MERGRSPCPSWRSAEHERLEADTFISLMLRSKVFEVTRHTRDGVRDLGDDSLSDSRLNYDYECKEQDKYEKAWRALASVLLFRCVHARRS